MDEESVENVKQGVHLLSRISNSCSEDAFSVFRALELISDIRSKSLSESVNENIVTAEFANYKKYND